MKKIKMTLKMFIAVSLIFIMIIAVESSNETFPISAEDLVITTKTNAVSPPAAINEVFPDPFLTETIASSFTKNPTDIITQEELNMITSFVIHDENITDISGIEFLTNLRTLDLSRNSITDISPLNGANFPQLQVLDISNQVINLPSLPWNEKIQVTNNITNLDSTILTPSTMSNNGMYVEPLVAWQMQSYIANLNYDFTTPITIASINSTFSGIVNQPLKEPVVYKLTYIVDGQRYVEESWPEKSYITPPQKPNKDNFIFEGWNTMENGGGTTWDFATNVMPANDMNLYAQWKEVKSVEINVDNDMTKNKELKPPMTGDKTNFNVLIILLIGTMFILVGVLLKKKSVENNKK